MADSVRVVSASLPLVRRLTFGVGHVLNDLCAAVWFSFLLVYFHHVVQFSNTWAGFVMLVGQVADAVCTPFVGYESDNTKEGFCKYGRRKTWHLVGTLCVACSFPFLFMGCINCAASPDWAQFIYYAPFVVIFQFGWASTQISHLALIPEISPDESERVGLNAIRYAFTVLSSITVYGVAWLLFEMHQSPGDNTSGLGPKDALKFKELSFIVVGIGLVFSIIFHIGTKERRVRKRNDDDDDTDSQICDSQEIISKTLPMMVTDWFKEPQFYLVGLLYMCTRLIVNLTQVYLPMYLTDTLNLQKSYIAIVPLVVFLAGFIMSFLMRLVNRLAGRKITYLIGLLFAAGACTWFHFIPQLQTLQIFGPAILLGFGTSTILVTSLSMTADLIGNHNESGAFVYGAMSFTDKLSNGIAVLLIQKLHPCNSVPQISEEVCCPACEWYYRTCVTIIPGGVILAALFILLAIAPFAIGSFKRDNDIIFIAKRDVPEDIEPLLNPEIGSQEHLENSNQQNNYGSVSDTVRT